MTKLEQDLMMSEGFGMRYFGLKKGSLTRFTAMASTASSRSRGSSEYASNWSNLIVLFFCCFGIDCSMREYVSSSVGGNVSRASSSSSKSVQFESESS